MSKNIHKSHTVTVLLYHLVFPAKYRRAVFDKGVDRALADACQEIEKRYQIQFIEIGTDEEHAHFLIQSVPGYSVTRLVIIIKSLSAREVLKKSPHVKKQLWGGEFWKRVDKALYATKAKQLNYITNEGIKKRIITGETTHIAKIKRELFFAVLSNLSRTKTLNVSKRGTNPVIKAASITRFSLYEPISFITNTNQMVVGKKHNNQSQSNHVLYFLAKTQATDESSMIKTTE